MRVEWLPSVLRRFYQRSSLVWSNSSRRRPAYRPMSNLEPLEDRSMLSEASLIGGLLNLPPIANADVFSVVQNTPLNSVTGVLLNDSDPNGDPLNAQLLTGPLNGALTLNPDGSFLYTPVAGFTGIDVFSYTANDGLLGSLLPGVVTLNVLPGSNNQPPVAANDTFHVNEDTILNLSLGTILDGVLANDSDPELLPLTAAVVTTTQHGNLIFLPTGTFIYTPDAGFHGTDSFTYQASDLFNNSNVATATFIVDPVNDAPIASTDLFSVIQNTPLNSVVSVLANDIDPDGDLLNAQLVTGPLHGILNLNPDGTFLYTPIGGFTGSDLFTYLANDGTLGSLVPGVVNLNILPGANNLPPVANNDTFHVNENSILNLSLGTILDGVLANDTDPELVPLTANVVTTTQHGSLIFLPTGTFIYTPDPGFTGTDTFTYQASDLFNLSNVATATFIVDAVNAPPVANSDAYTVTGAGAFNSVTSVLANDSDPDGDGLTAQLLLGPTHGTLTLNPNGTFTYTPTLGFVGVDVFTYFANDGTTNSLLPATVTLTTSAIANQPPTAVNDVFHVNQNSVLNLSAGTILDGVLANDTDPELIPLTAQLVTTTQHGTLTFLPTGTFIYTPNPGFTGADTFTYQASDLLNLSNVATATIIVDAVNLRPVANPDSFNVPANGVFNSAISVLANDTDPNGDTLTAQLVTGPTHGTLTLNPNGTFTYTPTLGFVGIDVFTYLAKDATTSSLLPATVTLTTAAVGNTPPVANNDTFHVNEDSVLNLSAGTIASGVLANDTDAESVPLIAFLVTPPQHGTFTFLPTGTFTYTPDPNFSGTDTFTYQASDGQSLSNVATASIVVDPLNDAPVVTNDSYATMINTTLNVSAANGVLANDTDPDANSTLTAAVVANPTHGTVTLNSNGSFVYTPTAGYTGTDTFTYRASDGLMISNVGTVTITISAGAAGTPPVAVNDAYSLNEDGTLTTTVANGVLFNDTDADGNTLTATLISNPSHGTVTLSANGTFTYTPDANFNGIDSFTYQANDGTSNSNVGIVQLTVNAANDAPIGNPDSYTTDSGTTLNVSGSGVLTNDVDPDGNPLTATVVANPTHGILTLNSNGSFTYVPNANFSGTDSFTYQANDATSNSGPVTVTLTINSTNSAPVAVNDSYSVDEDDVLTVAAQGVLGNDTDADGNTLTAIVVTQPQHGTLTLNANGSLTYTPDANFNGTDSFTYKANDGTTDSNVATVTITVGPQNEPPVIVTSAGTTSARGHKKTILDQQVDLIDPDSQSFNGGDLTVTITSGKGRKDTLGYRHGGARKGRVNVKHGQLRIGLTAIGTVTGGQKNGGPLHIVFNSNATQDRVETAMRNLIFRGTKAQPGPRVISWQITDDTGLDSNVATKSADVT